MSESSVRVAPGSARWFWSRGMPAALGLCAATAVATYLSCALIAGLLP